jgi:hypothetical protein
MDDDKKKKLAKATSDFTAFYAMMKVRTLKGFPLYEKVPQSPTVLMPITVTSNDQGSLYFVDDKENLVRCTGQIYDLLMGDNNPWKEGETVLASVWLRQAIPDLTPEDLEANYGKTSRNDNSAAIRNYLAEAAGNFNHMYCDEIIEEEEEEEEA